jgi:hypothetical protein
MGLNSMIPPLGNNLIFLVSQPRSGSTLLQRILGGHPDIHTTTEPWFMLEACETLRPRSAQQPYESGGWARLARDAFLKSAGGRETLVAGVRDGARTVYGRALQTSGKSRFLDKTPRYYYILPELAEVFPEARIVILLRNPLAVLCSLVRTWVQHHHERMPVYRDDLLLAPRLLDEGIRTLGSRVQVMRYEDLVRDPEMTMKSLCAWLCVPFVPAMLQYGRSADPGHAFGDPEGVHRHASAEAAHQDRWRDDLRDPRLWRWAQDYLGDIERNVPGLLGYDAADLHRCLLAARPPAWRCWGTCPLHRVLSAPAATASP